MRRIISLGLCALMFSLFSGQLLAEKFEACEKIKNDSAYKGLYGLCNAYWNADEAAKTQIMANLVKKAGTDIDVLELLGLVNPDVPEVVECPCWDVDVLDNMVACSGYTDILYRSDLTEDGSGFDLVVFQDSSISIQVWAGFTPIIWDEAKECLVNVIAGEGKPQYSQTSDDQDAACRLDILNLIAEPPTAADCVTE